MAPSRAPEAQAAYWKQYRQTSRPYAERACSECGEVFHYGWRAYWTKRRADELAAKRLAQEVLPFGESAS